jgi:hypothetical protein
MGLLGLVWLFVSVAGCMGYLLAVGVLTYHLSIV